MLKAYLLLTICLLADFILYLTEGISLAGQWSDQLLFWSWFLFTIILIVKYNRKKWARIYAGCLVGLIFLSWFPMGIPILSLIAFATDTNPDSEIMVEEYSIKLYAESVIATPKLAIIKRNLLTERIIAKPVAYLEIDEKTYSFSDIDSIDLRQKADTLIFTFHMEGKWLEKKILS